MKNMKPIVGIAVLVVFWYVGDAIYPNWDWSCNGRSVGGFSVGPGAPEGLGGDHTRAVNPDRPEGCTLRADNRLRRTFDWFAL
jgi:hypothetical protein